MRLIITQKGVTQAAFKTRQIGVRSRDTRPALEKIAADMRDIEVSVFDAQGRRGGGSWKPLKSATLARKARKGQDPRILHATLRLRNSLTEAENSEHIELIRGTELRFGTKVPYAGAHQDSQRANMPRRPFLKLTKSDVSRHSKITLDHLVQDW